MASTISRARAPASPDTAAIFTMPLSSISIVAPDSSWMARIVFPFGPMTSPIFDGLICIVMMRGAHSEMSSRCFGSASSMRSRMCMRPLWARSSASFMIWIVRPLILMSIWMDVTPSRVPATLKSMSPSASSRPRMSVRTATRSPSLMSPIATPAQAALIGTPASMSASDVPHTVAIDDEPFDSRMSETIRSV